MRSKTVGELRVSNEPELRRSPRLKASALLQAKKSRALKLVKAQERQNKPAKVKKTPLPKAKAKAKPKSAAKPAVKAKAKTKSKSKATVKVTVKSTAKTATKAAKPKAQIGAQPQTKRSPARQQECLICAETKPLGRGNSNFPRFSNCRHSAQTCSTCITKVLTIYLAGSDTLVYNTDTNAYSIDWTRCVCTDCDQSFPEMEIRARLSRLQILSIDRIIEKKIQEADGDWSWCTSAQCSARQKVNSAAVSKMKMPIVTCLACGGKSCFYHRIPWHKGYTCERYDDEHPNAQSLRSSEERIKRISKKCPTKGCKWRIQKSGGCPNMFCK